jgi:hypothetical protein
MTVRKERFRNAGAGKGVKDRLDPVTLRRLYVAERRTQAQIAREYGCSAQFVSLLLREYGVERHSPA